MGIGKLKGRGKSIWHFREGDKKYWSGAWYDRTPTQLLRECQTTIKDLYKNHPELKERDNG